MIELLPPPAEDVVALSVRGKVDASDMQTVVGAALDAAVRLNEKFGLYAEVQSLEGMTLEALFEDLRVTLRHFRDFDRAALVSDAGWLRKVAEFEDKLFPNIRVRSFTLEERDAALEWVRT